MVHETLEQYLKNKRGRAKQLATELGITPSYLSMLKKRQRRPSPELAQRLEDLTGVPFRNLLLGKRRTA